MTTAAQETVLRMALGMLAAYRESPLTLLQRQWVIKRLQSNALLTQKERAKLREPLLCYIKEHHPRVYDLVAEQF